MTEGFARVNQCFHRSWNTALMNGMQPTIALFGPEEFEEWENMKKMQTFMFKGPVIWLNAASIESTFCGLIVRRMPHPGVAILT